MNNENNILNDNKNIRQSIYFSNTWQEFLNNQIRQRSKGKNVQELKLSTEEMINNKKVDFYNVLYQGKEQTSTMNLLVSEGKNKEKL